MARIKKQKKNEKGEGSFRKRSNGTFEYRIVYTDEYNETKRKSFYGQSDIICMEKAEKFLMDMESEGYRLKRIRFSFLFEFAKASPKNVRYIFLYNFVKRNKI